MPSPALEIAVLHLEVDSVDGGDVLERDYHVVR